MRFQASMPNETWRSDCTHYRLTHSDGRSGAGVEIITRLGDWIRYVLRVSAHSRVTNPDRCQHLPHRGSSARSSQLTLTDEGMVYTVRFAGGRGGRNSFADELRRRHVIQ